MAKRKKKPGAEEKYIIVHFFDGKQWSFTPEFGLSKAIESATILTEKGYKCKIGYTDEDGRHIQIQ